MLDDYWYQQLSGSQDRLTYVSVNDIKAIQIENANGMAYHSVTIVSLAITLSSKLHIGLWIPTLVYFTINVIFDLRKKTTTNCRTNVYFTNITPTLEYYERFFHKKKKKWSFYSLVCDIYWPDLSLFSRVNIYDIM